MTDVISAGEIAGDRNEETADADNDTRALSQDDVFTTLSNHRRRCVLHYLKRNGGESTLHELATVVAAWENEVDADALTRQQRKRVYTALHQTHLPKMDSVGVIEYDRTRGAVTLAPLAEEFDVYLEIVERGEITWSQYYLLLAVIFGSVAVGVWQNLLPGAVSGIAYAGAFAVVLGVSAAVHEFWSHQGRIGSGRPPE